MTVRERAGQAREQVPSDVPGERPGHGLEDAEAGGSAVLHRGPGSAPGPVVSALIGLGTSPALLAVDLTAYAVATFTVRGTHVAFLVLLGLLLLLNANGGYYRPRLSPSALDDLPGFLGRALVAGAIATALKVLAGEEVGDRLLVASLVFALVALLLRAGAYAVVRLLRSSAHIAHATIIIGTGETGVQLADMLQEHPECGLRPVGFLDGDGPGQDGALPLPVLGGVDRLSTILTEQRIRNVVVADGANLESTAVDIVRTCDRMRCEIFLVPRLYDIHTVSRDMELVWGIPLVRLRRAPFRTWTWRLKRAFDIGLAGGAFLLLLPVLALCAALVRFDTGRKVIFHQERVGLDGRPFEVLKFRTLKPADPGESASTWSIAEDARVTRIGSFLRRTSLDELPQLWNVLKGDMSLVGPRPERPFFVERFTDEFPRYMARHRVPAGVTGWAQVHGLRGDTSIADRVRFDNYYIENWSLWEDVKILVRTAGQLVRATGR